MKPQDIHELEDWDDEEGEWQWVKSIRREKQKIAMKMSGKGLKDSERLIGERARKER